MKKVIKWIAKIILFVLFLPIWLIWHNEKRKIKDLIPTEGNPRQLTEKQAKDLESSLKKFNLMGERV